MLNQLCYAGSEIRIKTIHEAIVDILKVMGGIVNVSLNFVANQRAK